MKIEPTLECKDRQEVQAKKKQEFRLIGQVRRIKGLTLFEYNTSTGEMRPADLKREAMIGIDKKVVYSTKTQVRKDCIYIQALNEKNAWKRIERVMGKR